MFQINWISFHLYKWIEHQQCYRLHYNTLKVPFGIQIITLKWVKSSRKLETHSECLSVVLVIVYIMPCILQIKEDQTRHLSVWYAHTFKTNIYLYVAAQMFAAKSFSASTAHSIVNQHYVNVWKALNEKTFTTCTIFTRNKYYSYHTSTSASTTPVLPYIKMQRDDMEKHNKQNENPYKMFVGCHRIDNIIVCKPVYNSCGNTAWWW